MAKTWATKCCSGTYKNNYQLCCGIKAILIFCGVGSFFFWLIFWIFGIKEIFGISTMIIGAVIGFILWIWITFFGDNGGHSDYEHEDMDHDMPIHVKIDN